jgi:hypothetical protein
MATASTTTKSRAAKSSALNTAAAEAEAPATTTAAPAEEAPKQETESQKRNRLRNEAERVIINRHKSEFEDYATQLFADNGLKFNRRMSEQDKARAKVEELIKKHPELKDALLASLLPAQAEAPATGYEHSTSAAPRVESAPAVAYSEPQYDGPVEDSYDENTFAPSDPWAGRPVEAREGE